MYAMPSRTIFAPPVITRKPTLPGDWALRFELARNKRSYLVRAPLGAKVYLNGYQKRILEDSINGVPREETAAWYSEYTGKTQTLASLDFPLRAVKRRTHSRTISEAACKAVVLESVKLHLETDLQEPLDEATLAVLAAKCAGYEYKDMSFLSPIPKTLKNYSTPAREAFGLPEYAPQASVMGMAFACGSLVVGKPYDLASAMPMIPPPDA